MEPLMTFPILHESELQDGGPYRSVLNEVYATWHAQALYLSRVNADHRIEAGSGETYYDSEDFFGYYIGKNGSLEWTPDEPGNYIAAPTSTIRRCEHGHYIPSDEGIHSSYCVLCPTFLGYGGKA